ncbi:hypothetical protein EAO71_33895 [Streptomyces sp. ms191]|uniref:hypothetical protein n=1 Tax=unclassified Streptomyces TaxID=2593676 RepID=UPI0011CDE091|nr:hypothetical protein [Streptomyces sp. ms191]TXS19608.1 hypothetical protein EAO71_33895 [Streptomyces sp. ms191]
MIIFDQLCSLTGGFMRFKYTVATCAAALAAVFGPLAATPAAAAPLTTSDSVTATDFSYYGRMDIGWRVRPNRLDPINITLKDTATDGYAIGIRLITNGENGRIEWRMRTIPTGKDTATWTTYAAPGGYISLAYFEVCKIKVSTGVVTTCHASSVMHAPFDDSSL